MILVAFSMVLGCNGESGADGVSLPPFVTQLGAGAAVLAAYGMMRSGLPATAAASSPMNVDSDADVDIEAGACAGDIRNDGDDALGAACSLCSR